MIFVVFTNILEYFTNFKLKEIYLEYNALYFHTLLFLGIFKNDFRQIFHMFAMFFCLAWKITTHFHTLQIARGVLAKADRCGTGV